MKSTLLLRLVGLFLSTLLLAPTAAAQKNSSKAREFPAYGFSFKPLKDWSDVPPDGQMKALHVIGQFEAKRGVTVKTESNARLEYRPSLKVLKIDPPQSKSTGQSSGGGSLRNRLGTEAAAEKGAEEFVMDIFGPALRKDEYKLVEPEISTIKAKGIQAERNEILAFTVFDNGAFDMLFDVYTFRLPDYRIVFVWSYPAEKKTRKKWGKAVEKSMKSFKLDLNSIQTSSVKDVDSDSDYEDLLEFHRNEVMQTPGWHLVETPSKQYLIKTNSDNKKQIQEVIKRLEASRKIYEQDFPPAEPITSVSVVRICASKEDFQRYGRTSEGTAGYFNPASEELVLYFGETGKDATLSVISHEGFHQYCHFLFNRSEAHRWFDEGHGDYYGAWKMKGSKLVPNKDMKGGLSRIPTIKQMVREGTFKPVRRHVRFDHPTWQNQGPGGTGCYAESFSIVYFLREGARGKVSKKYWKSEYANIIPNYIRVLDEGFTQAYDAIQKDADEQLKALADSDADFELIQAAKERAEHPWNYLDQRTKTEIWNKAMGESWGKIDEIEFEERWKKFVSDEL